MVSRGAAAASKMGREALSGHSKAQREMIWQGGEALGSRSRGLGISPDVFKELKGTSHTVT